MNKKIKVIELLNKIANKDSIPKAILYKNEEFVFNGESFVCCDHDTTPLIKVINSLNDYVEILENNTEEIEELEYYYIGQEKSANLTKIIDKIEEIRVAVNQIRKDLNNDK